MIRIDKVEINDIAAYWARYVKTYLHEQLTGRNRVRYKDLYGKNHLFDRRLEKYKFIYIDKTRTITGVSVSIKNRVWSRIEESLNNEDFLKGSKNICDKWVRWHKIFLKDEKLKIAIKDIFVSIYEEMSSNIAYDIFERLNIRTCPYCNRHYTFTLHSTKNQFHARPEFDHFYDKNTYPLLAVTFFNLVPSCKECNHGKRNNECGVNPYFERFRSKFIIKKPGDDILDGIMNINEIFKISRESDFLLDFKMSGNCNIDEAEKKNIDTLGLLPLYNMHKDYVMEIVEKAAAYDKLARLDIIDKFQGVFHSEADVFNLIFGRYILDTNHSVRPLSKLTADILEQLEIGSIFTTS